MGPLEVETSDAHTKGPQGPALQLSLCLTKPRRLLLRRLYTLPGRNDQHRNWAVMEHIVADTAQKQCPDPAAATSARHHQVVLALAHLVEHHLRGRSGRKHGLRWNPGRNLSAGTAP